MTAAVAAEEGKVAVAAEGVGGAFGYLGAGRVQAAAYGLARGRAGAGEHALPAPAGARTRPHSADQRHVLYRPQVHQPRPTPPASSSASRSSPRPALLQHQLLRPQPCMTC